jgi:hypothetical protein
MTRNHRDALPRLFGIAEGQAGFFTVEQAEAVAFAVNHVRAGNETRECRGMTGSSSCRLLAPPDLTCILPTRSVPIGYSQRIGSRAGKSAHPAAHADKLQMVQSDVAELSQLVAAIRAFAPPALSAVATGNGSTFAGSEADLGSKRLFNLIDARGLRSCQMGNGPRPAKLAENPSDVVHIIRWFHQCRDECPAAASDRAESRNGLIKKISSLSAKHFSSRV